MKKENYLEASHRDSMFRKFQRIVAPIIPGIIGLLDRVGAFTGTDIHDARASGKELHADDITLSQLQIVSNICDSMSDKNFYPGFDFQYLLANLLDGMDGAVARLTGSISKEGGIKDASVDRLSEMMITQLIGKELGLEDEKVRELRVAFQFSTLTKAACELTSTKTSEGGQGSMIERRVALFLIMKDLINLKKIPKSFSSLRNSRTEKINQRLQYLIDASQKRAADRIQSMALKNAVITVPDDSESTAADEARKYAGLVHINDLIGINIIEELNSLTGGKLLFPTLEDMKEKPHIAKALINSQDFLNKALQIAGL